MYCASAWTAHGITAATARRRGGLPRIALPNRTWHTPRAPNSAAADPVKVLGCGVRLSALSGGVGCELDDDDLDLVQTCHASSGRVEVEDENGQRVNLHVGLVRPRFPTTKPEDHLTVI